VRVLAHHMAQQAARMQAGLTVCSNLLAAMALGGGGASGTPHHPRRRAPMQGRREPTRTPFGRCPIRRSDHGRGTLDSAGDAARPGREKVAYFTALGPGVHEDGCLPVIVRRAGAGGVSAPGGAAWARLMCGKPMHPNCSPAIVPHRPLSQRPIDATGGGK